MKKNSRKGWKIVKIVLLVLLALIVLAVIAVAILASKNVKQMDACVEETVAQLSKDHKIREVDAGEYAEMKAFGLLKFHVRQYEIEGIGNLSVMKVNAGVMQMATIVFSPFEKDLPLMSCDFMYMLSTRKAYVELYDLVEEKDDVYLSWMDRYEALRGKYSSLEDTSASSGWYDYLLTVAIYKAGGMKQDDDIRALLADSVSVYLEQADAYEPITAEQKTAKAAKIKEYSDRLIDEGGVSTSFFKSTFGEEITRDFFDKVFFGTETAK